ncbi:GPP34 family phosphoprotein [Lentzea flaviverrucosa]|uniref:Golgi phosphoprotein 3 (GPP34) n=1 Tax=Lentzea flaviverrucosa TaxID=200379 RepID=A0A1H9EW53_9PSEU|nr:GPP34 family phosphoprotein [Lentzea flaviverrucosa]RDI35379.1 Golgi phosphoprotein 3 GPP34 [Lentzea flaviverrucosa]SEQ29885.1 Golgi phosphoprotein 3 (GPP34) [Lentzea flaviverrucosa]
MTLSAKAPVPRGAAEQFYLSAHDDRGERQLNERALELGCATAVLGELVIEEYLQFSEEQALLRERGQMLLRSPLLNGQRPTIKRLLLGRVVGAPAVTPGSWITHIAPQAPLWIARRLLVAGVVTEITPHRLKFWDKKPRFVPNDPNEPHKLGDHLTLALQRRSVMTLQDLFLAGLLQATQMHHARITDIAGLDQRITDWINGLTTLVDPRRATRESSLRVLVSHTEHLINTALLAQTL